VPLEARIWRHVDKHSSPYGCWLWTGVLDKDGYGAITLGHGLKNVRAHRVAWEIANGPIPEGHAIAHNCMSFGAPNDNKRCVNPDHVRPLTPEAHGVETGAKRQVPTGDRHGLHAHPERAARGEHHGQAVLTADTVRRIRVRYAAGGVSQSQLAREFGTDQGNISAVVRHKTWRHVV
jgi:hypothetical protein